MTDIAKHVRIFSAQPDDEFVKKRKTAVKETEMVFRKMSHLKDLIKLGNDLAIAIHEPAQVDTSVADATIKAIKKQSEAFTEGGEELQIVVIATLAVIQYLETNKSPQAMKLSSQDVIALSLWSSLSFQPDTNQPKLEALRDELLNISKELVDIHSHSSRTRSVISELQDMQGSDIETLAANIKLSLSAILEPMKTNAALDREEIDILWWVLNDWSRIANHQISTLNSVQIGVISGLEISNMLRRIPAPAHYQMTLRAIENPDKLYTCAEIIEQLGEYAGIIAEQLEQNSVIAASPIVFPLFNAIITNSKDQNGYNLHRPLQEWAGRALLEGTILNLSKFLNDGR